jgi:hypothetical protein
VNKSRKNQDNDRAGALLRTLPRRKSGSSDDAAPLKMAREGFFFPLARSVHDYNLALHDGLLEERRGRTRRERRGGRCGPEESVGRGRELAAVRRLDDQALDGRESTPHVGDLGYDGSATVEHLQARHLTSYHEVRVLVLLYEADLPRRLGPVEVAGSAEPPFLEALVDGAFSGIAPAGGIGYGSQR